MSRPQQSITSINPQGHLEYVLQRHRVSEAKNVMAILLQRRSKPLAFLRSESKAALGEFLSKLSMKLQAV